MVAIIGKKIEKYVIFIVTSTSFSWCLLNREQELTRKLREILNSPLSEGVARIIEESYRLLAVIH